MSNYQIVLNGVMLAMDEQEVLLAFSRLFKLTPEAAAALLAKPKTVLRSHLDVATAERYREQLLAIGVDVDVCDASPKKILAGEQEDARIATNLHENLSLQPLALNKEDDKDFYRHYQGNRVLAVDFSASGFGYFPVWIVNVLFTALTLGIYSAWASVRSRVYFHHHTILDGFSFQYHAQPINLLRMRIVGIVWLSLYVWLPDQSPLAVLGVASSLLLLPAFFLWVVTEQRASVAWRHTGLVLDRDVVGIYKILLLPVILAGFTLGSSTWTALGFVDEAAHGYIRYGCAAVFFSAWPYWHCAINCFFVSQTHCGDVYFCSAARVSDYYKLYFIKAPLLFLLIFVPLSVLGYLAVGSDPLQFVADAVAAWRRVPLEAVPAEMLHFWQRNATAALLVLAAFTWLVAYTRARLLELRFNGLSLGKTVVACQVRASIMCWLYLSNLLGIVLTAGLFIPFAIVRTTQYRLSCITVHASYDLDDIVNHARFGDSSSDF